MATFLELKNAVAGAMLRDASELVGASSFDMLGKACNNAMMYAQRKHNFEYSKQLVTVPSVDISTGAAMSTGVLYGTATPVSIKRFQNAFITNTSGQTVPIDIVGRDAWYESLRRKWQRAEDNLTDYAHFNPSVPVQLMHLGTKIYLAVEDSTSIGGETTKDVHGDAYTWLTALSGDNDTNFLLDYGFDFIMWRSIIELNAFIKDDERVTVSAELMKDVWDNLVGWDNTFIGNTTTDNEMN